MREFAEFLGDQSPYDQLDPADLVRLAQTIEVEFFSAGEEIIAYGESGIDHIYVVRTGSVEVVDRGRVVDVLGPGDTFGHIAVLAGLPPAVSVRAAEETLCYVLPDPRTVVQEPERLRFAHYNTMVARQRLIAAGGTEARMDGPIANTMHPVLWCDANASVRDVATEMTNTNQKAALMSIGDDVYGIVTDDDFRKWVATGKVTLDAPVSRIASVPAESVEASSTVWATYMSMVRQGIHHMVIADSRGRPVGVSSVLDMVATGVRHPLVVRSAVASAKTMTDLAEAGKLLKPTIIELWDADVSSIQLGGVIAAVVDALVRRLIELDPASGGELHAHSWLVTGSMARQEPLPDSDVDTALVWRPVNPTDPLRGESMLALGARVLSHFTSCGLMPCPHDANASFPLFNRSRTEWRDAVKLWVSRPDELKHLILASAAVDARSLTAPELGQSIQTALLNASHDGAFMRAMIRFALDQRPPFGFVRNSMVGRFGESRKSLDLKSAGLAPIASLARALSLKAEDTSGSTLHRLDVAASADLLAHDEAETLKNAFELYHSILTEERVSALRSGNVPLTVIQPAQLDPLRRRYLRDAFRATNKIQDRLTDEMKISRI